MKSLLGRLKDKCWKYCSEYNRRKDVDENGMGWCCTCGKVLHWKNGDAGHFKAGRWNSILFWDKGIHLQCKMCNGRLRNRAVDDVDEAYERYVIKRYGKATVKEAEKLVKETKQFSIPELKSRIKDYQKLLTP